uniref:ARAD1D46816p n=1 Tax=Blastobotrys adeninivorans TaxID=409370 RepID=A0A060TDC4_BLAAD
MFGQLLAALKRPVATTSSSPLQAVFVRGMKTHQGAAKRWRLKANGQFKRKKCGRLHGNVGWSRSSVLQKLNGTTVAKGHGNGNQIKKLERMMPHAK